MAPPIIENPILNSPFDEPTRHFRFDDDGHHRRDRRGAGAQRRTSSRSPQPEEEGQAAAPSTPSGRATASSENDVINRIRERVDRWRQRRLRRRHADDPPAARVLDAIRTASGSCSSARSRRSRPRSTSPRSPRSTATPGSRTSCATTNERRQRRPVRGSRSRWRPAPARPSSWRCSSPGRRSTSSRTRRTRASPTRSSRHAGHHDPRPPARAAAQRPEQLLPRARPRARRTCCERLRPGEDRHHQLPRLHPARDAVEAGKLTKKILAAGGETEPVHGDAGPRWSAASAASSGNKKNIVVLNDEAHHCYRRQPDGRARRSSTGDERTEAEKREEEARVWIYGPGGGQAQARRPGDLRPVGHAVLPARLRLPRGHALPVGRVATSRSSTRSSRGIVKVPRVPVADDSMTGRAADVPRPLAAHPRRPAEEGPQDRRRRRRAEAARGARGRAAEPLRQLREVRSSSGSETRARRAADAAGVHRRLQQHQRLEARLRLDRRLGEDAAGRRDASSCRASSPLFSNVEDGRWSRARTRILVDSAQLESGEAMSAEFKKIAAAEIDEFKAEYRARFPGRDADDLTDEDLLREVMNTVGKPGKLGEHIRCVVSVSMLTEGWDANTVTHILGVRAFGTQLLCEQVVGRGLRRMSYAAERRRPCSSPSTPRSTACRSRSSRLLGARRPIRSRGPSPTRVRALEERIACEITFPRVRRLPLRAADRAADGAASRDDVAARALDRATSRRGPRTRRSSARPSIHTLDDLKARRPQRGRVPAREADAREVLPRDGATRTTAPVTDADVKPWLFPQVLEITRRWLAECVTLQGRHLPAAPAARSSSRTTPPTGSTSRSSRLAPASTPLKPILRPVRPDRVDALRRLRHDEARLRDRRRQVPRLARRRSTRTGRQKLAQTLEEMDEVARYVKNQGLSSRSRTRSTASERQYVPDFIVA